MNEMQIGTPVRYKRHKGWDGRIYRVRMTAEEINARRIFGLIVCVASVPLFVFAMAAAAGMI